MQSRVSRRNVFKMAGAAGVVLATGNAAKLARGQAPGQANKKTPERFTMDRMTSNAKSYEKLREYVETVPLVDTHDHTTELGPKYTDPINVTLAGGYFRADLTSASSEADVAIMTNAGLPLEERWPVFEKAWNRTKYTGYGMMMRRLFKKFYGVDEITLEALKQLQGKLLDLEDEKTFVRLLDEAKIAARIVNTFPNDYKAVLNKTWKMMPRGHLVIPLPEFHCSFFPTMLSVTSFDGVQRVGEALDRHITSLDEYLDSCFKIFKGYKDYGAVGFKDQCAYTRPLNFGNPPRADAEKIFNWMMEDPRRRLSHPDGLLPLDDFLFHEFMRMARDLDLPVQLHTGHMADFRNDVSKANAILLTSVLDLHRDVRFDLFHANWPYGGEFLFLGKNYPNVALDFCWANVIDPIYCQNLFKQALSCVPHGKIFAFGSDFFGQIDKGWAHASIARDNVAIALADMVEMNYLGLEDAKEVAYAWLFENANQFFRLGL